MKTLHFDSLSACIDNARQPFRRQANNAAFKKTVVDRKASTDWHGVDGGFSAVSEMVEFTGYAEGGQRIAAMTDSLRASLPPALGIRRKKRRAESGDEYDIHAAMRGAHDRAWTQGHKEIRHSLGIVRIIVDICASGCTSANDLQWRGVAGIALCAMLRQAGYSVEMVAAFGVQEAFADELLLWSCVIGSRHGSTDIESLAAVFALPGFFRTFGFAGVIRAADDARRTVNGGLGFPVPVSNIYDPRGDCIEFIVPAEVLNEQSARKWLEESIALLQGNSA